MGQPDLFAAGQAPLLDDATGRIDYMAGWADTDTADAWFADLLTEVDWRDERRLMYEREVDVPRLMAHYRFGRDRLPSAVASIVERMRATVEVPFNSVGLNLYRNEHDSVAPHNDRLRELVAGHPIALVSLGAVRRMLIRAKRPPRRVLQVDLEPGSMLTMSHAVQLHYDHGIPKQRETVGPRISLAFRVRE
jgi:alkylated DNA repair dioxygenase AlkB